MADPPIAEPAPTPIPIQKEWITVGSS